MKTISLSELNKHDQDGDCWIAIDEYVYDVSKFMDFHPGSKVAILQHAGQDCTDIFYDLHRQEVLDKYGKLRIAKLSGKKPVDRKQPIPCLEWASNRKIFLNDSHYRFKDAVEAFVKKELAPLIDDYEAGMTPDGDVMRKMGECGLLACMLGPGEHLKLAASLPGNIEPKEFDYFHSVILNEALKSLGSWGSIDGLIGGLTIGLPPVAKFASKGVRDEILPQILSGEKRICLAISEPIAGSDVAGITCEAKLTPDGSHFIVNGTKKWITGGCFADYFATAVRTGGKGHGGVSFLLIPREAGDVETKPIKTSYTPAAGTALVSFKDVKVDARYLLGDLHQGFKCIMANFVVERWAMAIGGSHLNRVVVEEAMLWAYNRKAFGKRLISQPQIQSMLAEMIAYTDSVQAYCDIVTHQMNGLSFLEINDRLAGTISLLKNQQVEASRIVSDRAVQILGGRALTEGGLGKVTSRFQKQFQFGAVLGGASTVLSTQAIRHFMKNFPKQSRL